MIWKTTILLSFALCVLGDGHHATSEQRVKINFKEHHGHHGEMSHIGSEKPEHHEEYAWSYPSYEFSYKVHDPYTHDMKGQKESREGDEVKGEYWLVEPDGRKRTVTYHADKHSGFHATVHYSDDHHHVEEHHDEEHHEEEHHEDKKEEKDDKKDHDSHDDEKHHDSEEGDEAGKDKADGEGEGDEGRGAEETRGDKEEVGKWIHDRFWGHRDDGRHHDHKSHQHEKHGDDKYRDEYHLDRYHMVRGDGHKHEEKHKDIGIIHGLGSYGPQRGHKNDDCGKEETKEESRPERREYNERHISPRLRSGAIVRENYMHPRFYRRSQSQRKSVTNY